MSSDYYVYEHRDLDGCLIYIGKGKEDRAWSPRYRSEEHSVLIRDWLSRGISSFATLLVSGVDNEKALRIEKVLIQELNPKFNKVHNSEGSSFRHRDQRTETNEGLGDCDEGCSDQRDFNFEEPNP